MPSVDISVVLCTYNRADVLRLQLESLIHQKTENTFTYEIVVVDDASTDNTRDVVEEFKRNAGVDVRYAQAGGLGVAHARNRAAEEATGDWVAFTDDDQVNEKDWLFELYDMARKKNADCVGGTRDLKLPCEPPFALTPQMRSILGEKFFPDSRIYVRDDMPTTGSILIRRSAFGVIGPFDDTLYWSGEDDLFARRILAAGLVVWFAPKSVVHHIIPEHRLSESYFRWASLRVGVAFAEVDQRAMGKGRTFINAFARLGRAALVHAPLFLLARLKRDQSAAIDRMCYCWRATSYTYQALHAMAPRLFPRERFFENLKMRAERDTLGAANKREN